MAEPSLSTEYRRPWEMCRLVTLNEADDDYDQPRLPWLQLSGTAQRPLSGPHHVGLVRCAVLLQMEMF